MESWQMHDDAYVQNVESVISFLLDVLNAGHRVYAHHAEELVVW